MKDIIHLDKRKGIIGIILSIIVFIVCAVWFSEIAGVIFATLFVLFGFIRIDTKTNKGKVLTNILWYVAITFMTWYASIDMVDASTYFTFYIDKQILNFLCIFIVYGIVFLFSANWRTAITIGSLFLMILSTSNGFVYQFRGKELGPMDIQSFSTALNVANQYSPEVSAGIAYSWLRWGLVCFAQFSFPKFNKKSKIWPRIDILITEIICVIVLFLGAEHIPIKVWDKQGTEINGYFLNFFMGIRDSSAKKPETYDPEAVETFAQQYVVNEEYGNVRKLPNIIAIMDESFADIRVLGNELKTNREIMPFIDSLQEDTIKGYALSSVFGGNTANSEFEFLTGHSMSLLPNNSIPYQQYINNNVCSLAWVLNSHGYKSVATHPYFANGWSRNTIYPYLGFEESTFIDSYPSENLIRGYISDREMFEQIMLRLNNSVDTEPLFLFGITIQNHGSYSYDKEDFVKTVELEGYRNDYPSAEQYLSLLCETDKAVEYLINSLKDYSEDTIVIFFGDHYPQIEGEFFAEQHGAYFSELPDRMLQHKVPFFIWANYDIPEQTVECTSLNYLSRYLLETAGIELSPYYSFMKEMEENIPAMNALGFYSKDRNTFVSYDEANEDENMWINQYSNLQYNNLFNAKNRSEIFFGRYMKKQNNNEATAEN